MSNQPDIVVDPERPLAGATWLTRPETRAVFAALAVAGYPARAVGGAVRNALLSHPVADIDIATPAEPLAVIAAATAAGLAAHPTGIEHGTITIVSDRVPHEVTTLRRDVATDGRRATVAFSTDWSEDAARRDFTINALYADIDGRVYDPLGTGRADLAARRVCFIGDAAARIREDYLRILRFFRFSAHYSDGALDVVSLAACDAERGGIATLSAERIRAEMLKLCTADAGPLQSVIAAMQRHGHLVNLCGSAPAPGRMSRFLAYKNNAETEAPPDPLARLASLVLHTPEDAARLSRRLRLSGDERARLLNMAHGLSTNLTAAPDIVAQRAILYRLGVGAYRDQIAFARLRQIGALHDDPRWLAAVNLPDVWTAPTLPVDGKDVIAAGVAPGPALGEILKQVENEWVINSFKGDRQDCLAAIAALIKAGRSTS